MPKSGWESRRIDFMCECCDEWFSVKPSRVALQKGPIRFCSRICKDISQHKNHDFICSKCGEQKGPDDFFRDSSKPRGHVARCKKCYASHVKNVLAFTPRHREWSIRGDARERDLPYGLTKEQFMQFWQKPCYYCGDAIATIGLDRVDNFKGYVMGNVVPCCTRCNGMKSNMPPEEFLNRCRIITERMDCNSAITHGGKY